MSKFLRSYLDDILLLAGCSLVLAGLALINIAITLIVGGLMLIGLGVLVGKAESSHVAK